MQHGVSTSSLELSGGTKSFDWVTHKWNVDYAFYKTSLDKYLLLFKAGQANGLTIDWRKRWAKNSVTTISTDTKPLIIPQASDPYARSASGDPLARH